MPVRGPCVLLLPLLLAQPARADDRLTQALALQEAMQQIIARAEPAVVCVLVSRSDAYQRYGPAPPFDSPGKLGKFNGDAALAALRQEQQEERRAILRLALHHPSHVPESFGSGVILDGSAGLVLTNAHIVRDARKIYVRLPGGRGSYADIHASDPRSDLAVLRLLDRVPNLTSLSLGDGGALRKGHFVVQLTHPFAPGFRDGGPSASWGIVSNLRRRASGQINENERNRATLHQYGSLIQTDARIEPGCSGGALLNLKGELVGVVTSIAAVTGAEAPASFAVPLDDGMKRILDVLLRGEEVEYGFLGIHLSANGGGRGVPVEYVADNSPAERAGFQIGDVVVSIDGKPILETDDLFLYLGQHLSGNTVKVEVLRAGQRRVLTPKLGKYYVPGQIIASARPAARFGLRVDEASIYTQKAHVRYVPEGVVIREVQVGSPADKAQLQPDKLICKVDGRPVRSPAELYQALDKAGPRVEISLRTGDNQEDKVILQK
jgi:S1-C subfamily serine protease